VEQSAHHPLLKLLPNLAVGSLPHAQVYLRLQDGPLILHRRTFEDVVARVGHGLLHRLLQLLNMLLRYFSEVRPAGTAGGISEGGFESVVDTANLTPAGTQIVTNLDAGLWSAVCARAFGSSSSRAATSWLAFATGMFTHENANQQAFENKYVNHRKQAYTNVYPGGDDVS
jgi:hypothetical protein